jgi:hypothetical protein
MMPTPNIAAALDHALNGCLPGREAVAVNEIMRAVQRMLQGTRFGGGSTFAY